MERFWAKVHKTDTCWLWMGAMDNKGYGRLRYNGSDEKAHRISWLLAGNTIPNGMVLRHAPHALCGHTQCVNPAHLSVGTRKQNGEDMVADGTSNRGIKHPNAKLTEAHVLEIRANIEDKMHVELAKQYGVSSCTISDIINRKRWAWLEPSV